MPKTRNAMVSSRRTTDPICLVIDVFQQQWGACQVMFPNYRSIYFGMSEPESRVAFYTCATENLPDAVREKLADQVKPQFIFFVDGKQVGYVNGADFTLIESNVNKFIPSLDD